MTSTTVAHTSVAVEQATERRRGAFEIHLAAPSMSIEEELAITDALKALGIVKNKYFLNVLNVPVDAQFGVPIGSPPTGHDLHNPHMMSTLVVTTFHQASGLVKEGMAVLRAHGKQGNFEIEKILGKNTEVETIDVASQFPGFKRIDDSPQFENHLVFRGTEKSLPSFAEIIGAFQQRLDMNVHQIVDFARCRKENVEAATRISRVATIYQPNRSSALELADKLSNSSDFLDYHLLITEQVCLVAEYC